jgi:hypothetical protein
MVSSAVMFTHLQGANVSVTGVVGRRPWQPRQPAEQVSTACLGRRCASRRLCRCFQLPTTVSCAPSIHRLHRQIRGGWIRACDWVLVGCALQAAGAAPQQPAGGPRPARRAAHAGADVALPWCAQLIVSFSILNLVAEAESSSDRSAAAHMERPSLRHSQQALRHSEGSLSSDSIDEPVMNSGCAMVCRAWQAAQQRLAGAVVSGDACQAAAAGRRAARCDARSAPHRSHTAA